MTDTMKKRLISSSIEVRENSYSPYSKFRVGAALLAESGKIYTGCNYENSAFGAGVCAERVALGAAISAGERRFEAICVSGKAGITPCGICRQALYEFGDMLVISCGADGGEVKEFRLSELLPAGFGM